MTQQHSQQDYRPRIKLADRNLNEQNETVVIPDDAIALSVEHDPDTGLMGGEGGAFVIKYLEPVDRDP